MRKANRIIALCLLCCFTVNTAYAGGGVTGGATEFTQIMNNAELVQQVKQLSDQIQNQITMIQDMVNNTLTIPDQFFRDVSGIYSSIKGVIDKTKGLSYSLANMDEELKRRFKSYADLSSLSSVSDFSSEYRKITDTQMDTVRNTMEAIGVSWKQLVNDDVSALEELQKKAQSATGRNQLIQATNQLLGLLAEDSMKLRQLQMMQAQMAGTAYETERAQSDLGNRRIESFFKRGDEDPVNIPDKSLIDSLGK
ncbi:MAG: P-type conjugative transfer protein TrbJ [Synergistaceae bacterium]|nr:P-type conjugative transfer protein TrbJ [Synergistaceae bacterium]